MRYCGGLEAGNAAGLSLSWIARWPHSVLGVTMATGVVRRAGALALFVVTNGELATSSGLGMPMIVKGDLA